MKIVDKKRFAASCLIAGIFLGSGGYVVRHRADVGNCIINATKSPVEQYMNSQRFVKRYGTTDDLNRWAREKMAEDEIPRSEDYDIIRFVIEKKTAEQTGEDINRREPGKSYVWYVPVDGE